ncbi:NAD-glutamate dehydrogenase [Devosia enhydra]|nr:NAD-glutamate dehydrogenase [Devosia enhydra]
MEPPFETRAALIARTRRLVDSEPNFARFLLATVKATDPADLSLYSAEALEAYLRQTYARIGKRDGAQRRVYVLPGRHPGDPDIVEAFTTDAPFIVDSVLAAIRALGGVIRYMSHPVLNLDPQSHRLLDAPSGDSVAESVLTVHIDPLGDDARRAALGAELEQVLADVALAVTGWKPMLARLTGLVEGLRTSPPRVPSAVLAEAIDFLGWLAEGNFIFLGLREYRLEGLAEEARLVPIEGSGLGILADPARRFLRAGADWVEMTPQHAAFLVEPDPVMVTKANIRSRVHRRVHLDYIGVKLYGADGRATGELRIVGLFTSASLATHPAEIPLVRRKVAEVKRRAGHDPASHSGKALHYALDTYPREELFQIAEDQLFEFAAEIAALADRPRVRVLPRPDRFDNFVSVLVYVPRERFSSELRERIGALLAEAYGGRVSAFVPHFPESDLVRVHFIIGRDGGPAPTPRREALEAGVTALMAGFGERLAAERQAPPDVADYAEAFTPAYQSRHSPAEALADIATIRALGDRFDADRTIALRLIAGEAGSARIGLRLFHRSTPVPLSDRVPMLEHFGFRVIDERTYVITPRGQPECYLHDMDLDLPAALASGGLAAEGLPDTGLVEEAILAVWSGEAENDGLNALTLLAGLPFVDVAILRALARYLRQVGVTYSRAYFAQVLASHHEAASALVTLFHTLHDEGFAGNRERAEHQARETLGAILSRISVLDEDRIVRRLANLVEATLRTNAFQRGPDGARRPALSFKFDCNKLSDLPEPRPYREIFVSSPRVEGIHLRMGAIARGGIRWSDRPEDFRTEVLALAKAQQEKNAIIVPVGAKGAFVPRLPVPPGDRDAVLREGMECYRIFISSLLDLTDTLDGETVVPPPDIVRHDGDDPYLVVAADKGTARFSDLANAIAAEHGFWLGDAFASGGSAGYDHKAMGITARGGWEAVKRHFREMDRDIAASSFSVAGVGDMSGDVFGNAMLLSDRIRLVAAFDHRDIFIDPDPDPERSFAERRRLFDLPRSSWQDYDKSVLSHGGGIYPRSAKTVPLFAEARRLLGLGQGDLTPNQVMRAILRAPVDLMWFGGIGTYVRGDAETDAEAGDKTNDAIRVAASELGAKVVGEGANLAVTQQGRIDFARAGGRINTDAIDNSAGVNSSDLEVNIKIAFGPLLRSGSMSRAERNDLLVQMTDEVRALCLANTYQQTLALSIARHRGLSVFPDHRALIAALETEGRLNRRVSVLPEDAALGQRAAAGEGLSRPELAVLLANAKLSLHDQLLESDVPDEPYLARQLLAYFPTLLVRKHEDLVTGHRLRREIIATVLANAMINRGGPSFLFEMTRATSANAGRVARAFAVARDAFGIEDLWRQVDGLDGALSGETQLALYAEIQRLLARTTLWFLRNGDLAQPLAELVLVYAEGVTDVLNLLPTLLPPSLARPIAEAAGRFEAGGAGKTIARRIAELPALAMSADIALVAARCGVRVGEAAQAFFGVLETFGLGKVLIEGDGIVLADRFDRMALDRALANLMRALRDLSADVLDEADGRVPVPTRLAAWAERQPETIARLAEQVRGLTQGEMTVSRLSVAAGLLSDLARSA